MLHRAYDRLLALSLGNRTVFLVLTAGIFASAVLVLRWVPTVFIPPKIDPIVNGTLQLPRGTAIEHTARVMSDIDRFIAEELMMREENEAGGGRADGTIVNWTAWIGKSAPRYTLGLNPGSSDPGVVNVLINTTDHLVIPRTIARIQSWARERHPDLDVQLRKIENGVPIAYPVEVRVGGGDIDRIYELIAPIRDWLLDHPGVEIERNGLEPAEAVPVACRRRLRPILLTTATTIGGMTPLWLGHDPMFETMAVTIMFGLLFATVLTLLFIPVIYTIFFRVRMAR